MEYNNFGEGAAVQRSKETSENLLSPEEQEKLILDHLNQVNIIANKRIRQIPKYSIVRIEDLISAGRVGLVEAAKKFDPTKEIKFKTLAEVRIQGAISDYLREIDPLPREFRTAVNQANSELAEQQSIALDREVTFTDLNPDILLKRFGMSIKNKHAKNFLRDLALAVGRQKHEADLEGLNTYGFNPEKDLINQITLNQITEIVNNPHFGFNSQERKLLQMILENKSSKEIKEGIASHGHPVSDGRVSQIRTSLETKLKHILFGNSTEESK